MATFHTIPALRPWPTALLAMTAGWALSASAHWQPLPEAPSTVRDSSNWLGLLEDPEGSLYTAVPTITSSHTGTCSFWRWRKCGGWQQIGSIQCRNTEVSLALPMFAKGAAIYFAGRFDQITAPGQSNGVRALNLAKFNANTGQWSAVGDNSLNVSVSCLCVDAADRVYIGSGQSGQPGTLNSAMLQVWDGARWSPLGGGVTNSTLAQRNPRGITALATDGTNVYVAGSFDSGCGGPFSPTLIKWNGAAWEAMNDGTVWNYYIRTRAGLDPVISSMAISGNDLLVTGSFSGPCSAKGRPSSPQNLARFSIHGGLAPGNMDAPSDHNGGARLCAVGNEVYLAGGFTSIGGRTMYGFARWSAGAWSPIAGNGAALRAYTGARWVPATGHNICADGDAVYLLGNITDAAGVPCDGALLWLLKNGPALAAAGRMPAPAPGPPQLPGVIRTSLRQNEFE